MIIITHPERCIYKSEGDPALHNCTFYCDPLSYDWKDKDPFNHDRIEWNEDPFIWSKYPLYSFCHSNQVWSSGKLEQIQGIECLYKPKKDELLLFASPTFDKRNKHRKTTFGTARHLKSFKGIIFDTVIRPLCLIELPVNEKKKDTDSTGKTFYRATEPYCRNLADIKNRIEAIRDELRENTNTDKKILDAVEYVCANYEYISIRHFPIETVGEKDEFAPNTHNRVTYLAIGDPEESYLAKKEASFDLALSRKISCYSAKRYGVPLKSENLPIDNISKEIWTAYFNDKDNDFVSFAELFSDYDSAKFIETRRMLELQNRINLDK